MCCLHGTVVWKLKPRSVWPPFLEIHTVGATEDHHIFLGGSTGPQTPQLTSCPSDKQ